MIFMKSLANSPGKVLSLLQSLSLDRRTHRIDKSMAGSGMRVRVDLYYYAFPVISRK